MLAENGSLPQIFFSSPCGLDIGEDLLRMKDIIGRTAAGYYFDFMSENNRWDLLIPILIDLPYEGQIPMIDAVTNNLSEKDNADLEAALALFREETRIRLLLDIVDPTLLERIKKCLDKETEKDIFEFETRLEKQNEPPDDDVCLASLGKHGIHSAGQVELYETERGM